MGLITVKRKVGYGDVWINDHGEVKEGETFLMPVEEALQREDWEMVGYVPDPKSDEPEPDPPTPPKSYKQFQEEKAKLTKPAPSFTPTIPKPQEVPDGDSPSRNS